MQNEIDSIGQTEQSKRLEFEINIDEERTIKKTILTSRCKTSAQTEQRNFNRY